MKKLNFQLSSISIKSGLDLANILRYKNTMKSICDHVDPYDKKRLSELGPKSEQNETDPPGKVSHRKGREKHDLY